MAKINVEKAFAGIVDGLELVGRRVLGAEESAELHAFITDIREALGVDDTTETPPAQPDEGSPVPAETAPAKKTAAAKKAN